MNPIPRPKELVKALMMVAAFVPMGPAFPQGQDQPPRGSAPSGQPNIVVIMGDDIGITDVSAYSMGLMGFHTPNIDSIAKDGMLFTDYYGEQSSTAGRAAFLTGQVSLRTGLSKVGLPGSPLGLQPGDATIAEVLKARGYATGQFGKNHFGDRDEFLPTNHGFDEFYGNLYHLNAEEEPELPDYPKDPEFRKRFGPRGVIHSYADGRIEDTGPLTAKRMETIDDDIAARSNNFLEQQTKAGKPVFLWINFTHMHYKTHLKPGSLGQGGPNLDPYVDAMIDHDKNVGEILKKIDDLGLRDNTLVLYTTDNGPQMNTWPDGAMTPFRGEKNTNWEGGYRVPALVRWPGHIKAGVVSNDIISHLDWMPTFTAMAGDPNLTDEMLKGMNVGKKKFKLHLDGYNFLPYLTGQTTTSPRKEFFYFSDDNDLVALRYNNYKQVFMEQRAQGTLQVWLEPFTPLRIPKLFNLRLDPYERADITSNTYYDWYVQHAFLIMPTTAIVGNFLQTFKEFPPRQKAASFTIDKAIEEMQKASAD
jgi:arylsulfatase A-like enzyme